MAQPKHSAKVRHENPSETAGEWGTSQNRWCAADSRGGLRAAAASALRAKGGYAYAGLSRLDTQAVSQQRWAGTSGELNRPGACGCPGGNVLSTRHARTAPCCRKWTNRRSCAAGDHRIVCRTAPGSPAGHQTQEAASCSAARNPAQPPCFHVAAKDGGYRI